MAANITRTEYSKRRGVTQRAVQVAIETGRISVEPDGKINPDRADKEWEDNTNPEARRQGDHGAKKRNKPGAGRPPKTAPAAAAGGAGPTIMQSQQVKLAYEARLTKLKYQKELGELIDREESKRIMTQIVTTTRTKFLALPAKIKSRIPKLAAKEVGIIETLVYEILEDMANGSNGRD